MYAYRTTLVVLCLCLPTSLLGQEPAADEGGEIAKEKSPEDRILEKIDKLGPAASKYARLRIFGFGNDFKRPTLSRVDQLRQGQVGELSDWSTTSNESFTVTQVIDDRNMLLKKASVWIEGLSTKNLVDGSDVSLSGVVLLVKGTKRYTSVTGASRTVWHLVSVDVTEADALVEQYRGLQDYREWKDLTGKFSVRAMVDAYEDGIVHLLKIDGTVIKVPWIRLSKADRRYVIREARRLDSAERAAR